MRLKKLSLARRKINEHGFQTERDFIQFQKDVGVGCESQNKSCEARCSIKRIYNQLRLDQASRVHRQRFHSAMKISDYWQEFLRRLMTPSNESLRKLLIESLSWSPIASSSWFSSAKLLCRYTHIYFFSFCQFLFCRIIKKNEQRKKISSKRKSFRQKKRKVSRRHLVFSLRKKILHYHSTRLLEMPFRDFFLNFIISNTQLALWSDRLFSSQCKLCSDSEGNLLTLLESFHKSFQALKMKSSLSIFHRWWAFLFTFASRSFWWKISSIIFTFLILIVEFFLRDEAECLIFRFAISSRFWKTLKVISGNKKINSVITQARRGHNEICLF